MEFHSQRNCFVWQIYSYAHQARFMSNQEQKSFLSIANNNGIDFNIDKLAFRFLMGLCEVEQT